MFDQQTVRVAGLTNRVLGEVLIVEIIGAALTDVAVWAAIGIRPRSDPLLLAALTVAIPVYMIIDLDRSTHGLIRVLTRC
jgi:hypothetical protein